VICNIIFNVILCYLDRLRVFCTFSIHQTIPYTNSCTYWQLFTSTVY